jgi:aminoglycoside phosphotransferase (APT) family kinase protein
MSADQATTPRSGEELDVEALGRWLGSAVTVEQFPGGHSNLTYLVQAGDAEYVLRRPPAGPVPPKAHDMAREFRFLQAVYPHFPLAPRPIALCEDLTVLGCVFFLMERRRGRIVRTEPPEVELRGSLSRAFVGTLARLHLVDAQLPELTVLGRPSGFLERQVKGWRDRWLGAHPEQSPEFDRILRWLTERVPANSEIAIVHNDYKLDNLMFDEREPERVAAVLDWEMATIGDPLLDVGVALSYWCHAAPMGLITTQPGWWSRDELVQAYTLRMGREPAGLLWYEVFGLFKLAVIVQQIYARWQRGQTADARFRRFGEIGDELGHTAARLLEHSF